jgi:2'-5' RNA ligase
MPRLRPVLPQSHSALVVPVPAAEPLVQAWRDRYDPSAAAGMPAHITVLYPFAPRRALDALEDELASVAASLAPFEFRLERVGRFPGVLYLEPEPATPFVELTRTFTERWPQYQPYAGAFDAVVPHLTIAIGEEPDGAEAELAGALPLAARAEELWLMTKPLRRTWRLRRALPLSGR